ncbi:MAG TPA: DUF1634 domain-containing protein [Candidatus Acidoferrales bacterium]
MVNSSQPSSIPARPGIAADSRMLEILVGRVLFWGGLLSILVVLSGFGLHLLRGAAEGNYDVVGEVTGPSSASAGNHAPGVFVSGAQIIQGLRRRPIDPLAIIALGLVMLLATPVLAVGLAVPAFAVIRDYRYLVISLIILGILAVGLLSGG